MRPILAAGALALLASPLPAVAQDTALSDMTDTLRDPAAKSQITGLVSALTQVLLDLDVAPVIEAAESMAGEPMRESDGRTTLRELAPEAEALPEIVEQELPQALDRMANMGDAMQTMLPALRDIAEQMKHVVGEKAVSVR